MQLDHHVNWAIYNYPTLYRSATYAESRLKVLDQLFFVIGNGYVWHEGGFLFHGRLSQQRKTLPKGYFDKRLFSLKFEPKEKDRVSSMVEDRFHYFTIGNYCVFEATVGDEPAIANYPRRPYPLCKYSALVEILNGKTLSGLEIHPQPDWVQGCVDAARDAMDYFGRKERYLADSYHPETTVKRMEFDMAVAKREKTVPHWHKNLKAGETIEQYAKRIWTSYRRKQVGILKQFLGKFDLAT